MEFLDLNNELFQLLPVRSSNSGSSGVGGGASGLLQSFVATGCPHLMTRVIQTPNGSHLDDNIYAIPANNYDANNNAQAFDKTNERG